MGKFLEDGNVENKASASAQSAAVEANGAEVADSGDAEMRAQAIREVEIRAEQEARELFIYLENKARETKVGDDSADESLDGLVSGHSSEADDSDEEGVADAFDIVDRCIAFLTKDTPLEVQSVSMPESTKDANTQLELAEDAIAGLSALDRFKILMPGRSATKPTPMAARALGIADDEHPKLYSRDGNSKLLEHSSDGRSGQSTHSQMAADSATDGRNGKSAETHTAGESYGPSFGKYLAEKERPGENTLITADTPSQLLPSSKQASDRGAKKKVGAKDESDDNSLPDLIDPAEVLKDQKPSTVKEVEEKERTLQCAQSSCTSIVFMEELEQAMDTQTFLFDQLGEAEEKARLEEEAKKQAEEQEAKRVLEVEAQEEAEEAKRQEEAKKKELEEQEAKKQADEEEARKAQELKAQQEAEVQEKTGKTSANSAATVPFHLNLDKNGVLRGSCKKCKDCKAWQQRGLSRIKWRQARSRSPKRVVSYCDFCRCADCDHADLTHWFLQARMRMVQFRNQKHTWRLLPDSHPLPADALTLKWSPTDVALYVLSWGRCDPRMIGTLDKEESDPKLVSVCVPTSSRRHHFHELMYQNFRTQTYTPKELVVVDTGSVPSAFLQEKAKTELDIIYHHFPVEDARSGCASSCRDTWSLGFKRNLAAHLSRGSSIAHFDDDDLYAPNYLCYMQQQLVYAMSGQSRFRVCERSPRVFPAIITLSEWHTFAFEDRSFYCIHPGNDPMKEDSWRYPMTWGYGFSYVYTRAAWERVAFPDQENCEDDDFMEGLKRDPGTVAKLVALPGDSTAIVAHVTHSSNTGVMEKEGKRRLGRKLTEVPEGFKHLMPILNRASQTG